MNFLRFFKYLQLLLGISSLFSSVLPLNVIVFNAQLAEKLNETKVRHIQYDLSYFLVVTSQWKLIDVSETDFVLVMQCNT